MRVIADDPVLHGTYSCHFFLKDCITGVPERWVKSQEKHVLKIAGKANQGAQAVCYAVSAPNFPSRCSSSFCGLATLRNVFFCSRERDLEFCRAKICRGAGFHLAYSGCGKKYPVAMRCERSDVQMIRMRPIYSSSWARRCRSGKGLEEGFFPGNPHGKRPDFASTDGSRSKQIEEETNFRGLLRPLEDR
jgi:hypothetical protein